VNVAASHRCRWAFSESTANSCAHNVQYVTIQYATDWTVLVVSVLLLRVRRLGIHCLTVSVRTVTKNWVKPFSDVTWRLTFFAKYWHQAISIALEISLSMHYINWHFIYLLTCRHYSMIIAFQPSNLLYQRHTSIYTYICNIMLSWWV